jgi:hypothetical protein
MHNPLAAWLMRFCLTPNECLNGGVDKGCPFAVGPCFAKGAKAVAREKPRARVVRRYVQHHENRGSAIRGDPTYHGA